MQGWVKINVDDAVFSDINCIGVGSVIRDECGTFVRARCRRIEGLLNPREAEAVGLKETLSWVKNLNFKKCVFKTDAKECADMHVMGIEAILIFILLSQIVLNTVSTLMIC